MFIRSGLLVAATVMMGCGSTRLGGSNETQAPAVPRGDADFYGEIPAGTQVEVQLQQ